MADRDLGRERSTFLARLRASTPARIALGRTGVSIATTDHLAFQLAHAQARDAVHDVFDVPSMLAGLQAHGWRSRPVASEAGSRQTYLARPDLGRRLDAASRETLAREKRGYDILFIVADGLSAKAVTRHALPFLDALAPHLTGLRIGPVIVAEQGRVAIGDEIGVTLKARLVCVLIGERPGLSSPDSLGAYLTFAPAVGRTDSERNCLSNIRTQGMGYDEAANRCAWLIRQSLARGHTGVALKDESDAAAVAGMIARPVRPGS